jgi:hypothetical protein
MIRNKIFIGDSLLKLSRKDEAAKYFESASKVGSCLHVFLLLCSQIFVDGSKVRERPKVR